MSGLFYPAIKAALSGLIIMAVSEIARRNSALGALVASLPLVSLLAIIWLWNDTGDSERIAAHAEATFWYVLPTLPMFLALPLMLRSGMGFWAAIGISCVLTFVLYLAAIWIAALFGVRM